MNTEQSTDIAIVETEASASLPPSERILAPLELADYCFSGIR